MKNRVFFSEDENREVVRGQVLKGLSGVCILAHWWWGAIEEHWAGKWCSYTLSLEMPLQYSWELPGTLSTEETQGWGEDDTLLVSRLQWVKGSGQLDSWIFSQSVQLPGYKGEREGRCLFLLISFLGSRHLQSFPRKPSHTTVFLKPWIHPSHNCLAV